LRARQPGAHKLDHLRDGDAPRAISKDSVTPCGLAAINSSVRGDQTVESERIVGLARR